MVRLAHPDDIPRLVELGRVFYDQTRLAHVVEYDNASITVFLTNLINCSVSTAIVAERGGHIVGGIGGVVIPCYWNKAHAIGQQMFLYLEPDYRGPAVLGLLRAWEAWGRERGADVFMSGWKIETESLGKAGHFLERMGYNALECTCVKGIKTCQQQA